MFERPSKTEIELYDLKHFLSFFDDISNRKSFEIEGPRDSFPDFIIKLEGQSIKVELTRAPSSEKRMKGKNNMLLIHQRLDKELKNEGIFFDSFLRDDPNLASNELINYLEEVIEWARSNKDLQLGESLQQQFGECTLELFNSNNRKTLRYKLSSMPYAVTPNSLNNWCSEIADYVVNSVAKKVKKYSNSDKYADILLIKPDYYQPMNTHNTEEMSKLKSIIIDAVHNKTIDGRRITEIIPNYFGELWVLFPHSTFSVFSRTSFISGAIK